MPFKANKEQMVKRDRLASDLRKRANELNTAIVGYNRQIIPLVEAVSEAQARYNEVLEDARTLASEVFNSAEQAFEAKSERWQDSDAGIQVRTWIEAWELSLDDVELDLPETLEEIDPEEHADALASGPATPEAMEPAV